MLTILEDIIFLTIVVPFALASLYGVLSIKSFYKDPSRLPLHPPKWWLYSKNGWHKWARAMPVFVLYALPGTLGAVLAEYGDTSNTVVKNSLLSLGVIVIFGFVLGLFIALTGRPKWIIPKHLR